MFRNRTIQMKLVKDEEVPPWDREDTNIADTVSEATVEVLFAATVCLGTYLAMDTVRQIVVHTAMVKIR